VTTLLHEAYLEISKREGAVFPDRARFMAYATNVMRGLIIDYARHRQARKRGGGFHITSLGGGKVGDTAADEKQLSQIREALDDLAAADPSLAQVVDLKFLCGFSFAEIAVMRGVSERTVQRHWEKVRRLALEADGTVDGGGLERAQRDTSPAGVVPRAIARRLSLFAFRFLFSRVSGAVWTGGGSAPPRARG
jgi:RNA polymerase sigma factor (TIGR02999 family)